MRKLSIFRNRLNTKMNTDSKPRTCNLSVAQLHDLVERLRQERDAWKQVATNLQKNPIGRPRRNIEAVLESTDDHLLTTEDAADLLGVSRQFVYQLIYKGRLPTARLAVGASGARKMIRIKHSDVAAFIKNVVVEQEADLPPMENVQEPTHRLLTCKQVSQKLSLSLSTIGRMARDGELPAHILSVRGRITTYRFDAMELDEWIENRNTLKKTDKKIVSQIRKVGKLAWINQEKKKLSLVKRIINS